MRWAGLYLRGEQDGELIVNRTSLGYRDEYTLSGRRFLFAQIDYFRDTFKLIDYLAAPTAGVGLKVINTDPTQFSVDVGAGSVWEKNPDVDVRTSGAITGGERLTHQLTSTASIKHAITGLWKTHDMADGLYTFSVGLATRISDRVQLSIDLLDTLKNRRPTAATKKNDVALVNTIVNFLIVAFALFLLIKAMNATKKQQAAALPPAAEPSKEEVLLTQIRDLLAQR